MTDAHTPFLSYASANPTNECPGWAGSCDTLLATSHTSCLIYLYTHYCCYGNQTFTTGKVTYHIRTSQASEQVTNCMGGKTKKLRAHFSFDFLLFGNLVQLERGPWDSRDLPSMPGQNNGWILGMLCVPHKCSLTARTGKEIPTKWREGRRGRR